MSPRWSGTHGGLVAHRVDGGAQVAPLRRLPRPVEVVGEGAQRGDQILIGLRERRRHGTPRHQVGGGL
jgi:hypothetical protein